MIPNPADGICAERAHGSSGSAKRRRERQLRSMLRHERMSVAMGLAEKLHHSSRGQRMARAWEEESEMKYTAKFRTSPPLQLVLFSLFEEEPGGGRPEAFVEPRPQELVLRHTVEHITDLVRVAPMVQILDASVPQTVEPHPEQAIEVPKILLDDVPMRAAERDTQLGEQLVEVPTQPRYVALVLASKVHSMREIRRILQGLDPWGRGGGGARGGLQSSRSGQNSTEYLDQIVENPVPQVRREGRGGLQGSLPVQNSAAVVEQIVDIPARRGLLVRDMVLLPHRVVCMTMRMRILQGFFALFPVRKKVRSWARTRGRHCSPSRAHPRGELMRTGMLLGDVVTSL